MPASGQITSGDEILGPLSVVVYHEGFVCFPKLLFYNTWAFTV